VQLDDAKQARRSGGFAIAPGQLALDRVVERTTSRRPALFGFPPPGHRFRTAETWAGTALRYPGLDLTPWAGVL
jgi:hypothetical protein